jgi:hypothetical protein
MTEMPGGRYIPLTWRTCGRFSGDDELRLSRSPSHKDATVAKYRGCNAALVILTSKQLGPRKWFVHEELGYARRDDDGRGA